MEKPRSLKNSIYLDLRQKLIECNYQPGTILNETALTEEYGVSRTPIREAINRLEMDGYVKILPKKGIYITDISLQNSLQIFQTRIEIEPLTLKMAIPFLQTTELLEFRSRFLTTEPEVTEAFRLDTEMHLYLIDHCGNHYLIEMMHKLFDDNTRVVIASKQNKVKLHDASCEHLEILDSLIAQDPPEKSAQLMRTHVETCRKAALDYFYSPEFAQALQPTSSRRLR